MDNLTFISKVIEFSIWPICILAIVIILRKSIFTQLSQLTKFRAKDFELEFAQELKSITATVNTKTNDLPVPQNIKKLAFENPSLAIIESWRNVEIALTEHAKILLGEEKSFDDLIKEIRFHSLIDYRKFSVIERMRRLRNSVVHSSEVILSANDAINFEKNCAQIIKEFVSIMEIPKIKLTFLTYLILEVNAMIDTGEFGNISLTDIKGKIEEEKLIEFLSEISKGKADFSLILNDSVYSKYKAIYNKEIKDILGGYSGSERKKWGIENLGLCLVVAWTNEIIQRGSGWKPNLTS